GVPSAAALPLPLLHAWRRPLRIAMSMQSRSAAADGRGADLPAAEDKARQRQPVARARPGAGAMTSSGEVAMFASRERTLPTMLTRQAERYGDRILVSAGAASWSYRQVVEIAARSAGRLL